ncbi:MAG: hypothetical protein SF182_25820 [Deltaproteobacteria bacterium]|nr:hypothetical protein [Deltaproteobacteria bacterium]
MGIGTQWRATRRRHRVLIGGALFGAAFAYLFAFRNEGIFHLDAVYLAQAVEDLYRGVWHRDWRCGAVLANAVVYFPFWLVGEDAERATVLASVLFHALAVALAFRFVARLSGRPLQAALAAGLFALSPVFSVANTFGKEYGLALLALLAAFDGAVAAHDRDSAPRAALAGLLLGVSYTIWEGLLLVTPILPLLLFAPRRCRRRPAPGPRRVAAGAALGYALGLGFALATSLLSMLRTYAATPQMTHVGDAAAVTLLAAGGDLVRLQGGPFLAAAGLGLGLAWRQARYRPVLACAALLAATGPVYGALTTYGPRYLALCALGLAMFAGAAFDFLLRTPGARVASAACYALTLAAMLAAAHPLLAERRSYNGPKRYAQLIADQTEPDSLILVMDDSRFVEYYARRATLGHPIGDRAAIDAWVRQVVRESERRPVYLTDSGLMYDPGHLVRRALDQHFTFVLVATQPTEDYHHAEGLLRPYQGHLWRLQRQ